MHRSDHTEEKNKMPLEGENGRSAKCSKNVSGEKCFGCQQLFCTKHLGKHRSSLAQQMDELYQKQELLQQDLDRNTFDYPLLSSIYAWERKSMRKIQEVAEKARNDLQQWAEKTKIEVKTSLDQITEQLNSTEKSDNYTELDLQKWTKQLDTLRNLMEKPTTISIVEDGKSSDCIRPIKVVDKHSTLPPLIVLESNQSHSQETTESVKEHFVKMYGPCNLSKDNRVATHSSYRAGLSQISGKNHYSSGRYAVDLLIEKKGVKNLFIGIVSASHTIISPTFDYSVHGWWNFEHTIVNGEAKTGETDEDFESGDRITLIIDCEHQQLQLLHHRTEKLVSLPIKLEVCPFPWKLIVRLLTTGDCIRIV
jgi:hypothetical protein